MNILILHNGYLQPGGEDEVVKAEKNLLQRHGHQVFLHERRNQEIQQYPLLKKAKFLLNDVYGSEESYVSLRKIIQEKRPDIVHIHNTFSVLTPSVYQACVDCDCPIVQTLHNYRFLCPIGVFHRKNDVCEDCLTKGRFSAVINRCWKNSYPLSWVLKKTVDQFYAKGIIQDQISSFIVLSQFSKSKYEQAGFPREKIFVKPNFLDFDPAVQQQTGAYGLFVGGLHWYKGITTLLEASKILKGKIPIKVIGEGPLRDKISASSKENNVEFLGQKTLTEVITAIQGALFVVVPSVCYETFSRVSMEAYACGVPIIVSRIGALTELVVENETGLLFEPGNASDLAQKINMLSADPARCRAMGKRAREVYENRFSAQSNYQQLMSIYSQTINRFLQSRNVSHV